MTSDPFIVSKDGNGEKNFISNPPDIASITNPPLFNTTTICPFGLEPLLAVDGIYVHQLIELLEIMVGIETNNRYEILDGSGQRIYMAQETSDACVTACIGPNRPFQIQILDFQGVAILTISREGSCGLCCGCGQCGLNKVDVLHVSGEHLGTATQVYGCCTPLFELRDGTGEIAFKVNGPSCGGCCCAMGPCCNVDFHVTLPNGETEIGVIQKKASLRELISDANTFGVKFPMNLTPKLKALILAVVFVIDFGYFEHAQNQQGRRAY